MAGGKYGKLLDPGSPAPDFRLPRLDGGTVELQDILAKGPALIAFFKTTCPVCQFTFPFLARIHKPGTLSVYAVSQDDAGLYECTAWDNTKAKAQTAPMVRGVSAQTCVSIVDSPT